jgi:hypothetical protein
VSTSPEADEIRVGRVSIPLATAQRWITDYTSPMNVTAVKPYAYPAYDRYEHDRNDPRQLTDADLLAPGLLNVPVKIRSFYDLQRIRPQLEAGLANDDLATPLAEIDDPDRVAAMVAPLYAVLDNPQTSPWKSGAPRSPKCCTESAPKVLCCTISGSEPATSVTMLRSRVKGRSWAEYMVAVTLAIGHDIRTQPAAFGTLDRATSCPGELTDVRLLDMLAWKSQGASPSEAADA